MNSKEFIAKGDATKIRRLVLARGFEIVSTIERDVG